ncbi:MAG: thioredoxin family protein [Candidatus Diapherotrites archaeon]|nr:thioredoxin family protein [Candidatus Diapherotrites archaeon]
MKLLLFTSSHCPHCPKAVKMAKRILPEFKGKDVDYRKIRMKTSEGKRLADEYDVNATPTILAFDGSGKLIKKIVGVPNEGELRNAIKKGLGEKTSFLSKLFGG